MPAQLILQKKKTLRMNDREGRSWILRRDVYTRALDGFVIGFASWTIYCHLLVYSSADFKTLVYFCFVPGVLAGGLLYLLPHLEAKQLAGPSGEKKLSRAARVPWHSKLFGAATIAVVYAWTGNYLLFWILAVGFLVFIILDGPSVVESEAQPGEIQLRRAKWVVAGLALLAVAITLVAHRGDQDDAFYLNMAVSTLDFPDRPMLRYNGMYGEHDLLMLEAYYRVHSYELFVALASFLSRLDPRWLYYIVFPAVFASYVIIAHWQALRQLSGKTALVGILLIFIVLLAWGDVHKSYGNFSFVRLFQGKSIMVSVCIPAIVYYALRYTSQRDLRSWLLLALAQIVAVGFSSSGLLVAPLVAGIVLLGAWRSDRTSRRAVLFGLLTSMYIVVPAILILMERIATYGLARITIGMPAYVGTQENLNAVLGQGWRAYLALFALLAAPALPTNAARYRNMAGFILMIVLIVLNPMTSNLLGGFVSNMSWRVFWAIPFPLILGLAGTGVAALPPKTEYRRWGIVGAVMLAVVFILAPGTWTLSSQNRTRLDVPGYKVVCDYETAESVVALTPPGGLILAPRQVSLCVPLFPKHPRLVAVRPFYLSMIQKALGKQEADKRLMMMSFVEGAPADAERRLPEVLEEIQQRSITTIVVPQHLRPTLGEELTKLGYLRHEVKKYELWVLSQ